MIPNYIIDLFAEFAKYEPDLDQFSNMNEKEKFEFTCRIADKIENQIIKYNEINNKKKYLQTTIEFK